MTLDIRRRACHTAAPAARVICHEVLWELKSKSQPQKSLSARLPRRSWFRRVITPLRAGALVCGVLVLSGAGIAPRAQTALATDVTGIKRVMVLRVHFHDYTATSRYSRADVEGFFGDLNQLWGQTSYGKISISAQVTDLYELPSNRSAYVDDLPGGDLSNDGKFWTVLNDAIDNAPTNAGLDWTNLDAIMVVMAETSTSQFHRGQGTGSCTLKQGPNGTNKQVGCAIFSENPSDPDAGVWGRWAHEIGHAFQVAGPAHPSNYNNSFELMDANYPGQTGVFEKLSDKAFPGWMPPDHYQNVVPNVNGAAPSWAPAGSAVGGALVNLRAMEYDPAGVPNFQVARAYISANLYYLISVRRRVLGDDLNPFNTPSGIPDEGVLIERVAEGGNTTLNDCSLTSPCPRWVEVKGPSNNSTSLWKAGESYSGDGVTIFIRTPLDPNNDNWEVRIRYHVDARPDVAISPWRSPPSNSWESTDIWVDSPVNGYGTYRYGTQASTFGDAVPTGNGDDPAVDQANRIYVRVRNLGTTDASNVVVHIDRTDPEGRGIAGSNGFINIGSTTIANIPAGGTSDAFVTYTPSFTPTADQLAQGTFYFHTCLRVRIDPVGNELVLGNQDGDGEQENVDYFQAPPSPSPGAAPHQDSFVLRNNDPTSPRFFNLSYFTDLPPGWGVSINGGELGVTLEGGEVKSIPVQIGPEELGRKVENGSKLEPGAIYHVDVLAQYEHELLNPLLPPLHRLHDEFTPLGGIRFEIRIVAKTTVTCRARRVGPYGNKVIVAGRLKTDLPPGKRAVVLIERARASPLQLFRRGAKLARVKNGRFKGSLSVNDQVPADRVVCLFAGTARLASDSSGLIQIH